jgi:hypothetical protein
LRVELEKTLINILSEEEEDEEIDRADVCKKATFWVNLNQPVSLSLRRITGISFRKGIKSKVGLK